MIFVAVQDVSRKYDETWTFVGGDEFKKEMVRPNIILLFAKKQQQKAWMIKNECACMIVESKICRKPNKKI